MPADYVRKGILKVTDASPLEKETAVNLARQMGSANAAAKELGIQAATLRRWLADVGEHSNGRKRPNGFRNADVFPAEAKLKPMVAQINNSAIQSLYDKAQRASEIQLEAMERIASLIPHEEDIRKLSGVVDSMQKVIRENMPNEAQMKNNNSAIQAVQNIQNNFIVNQSQSAELLRNALEEWKTNNKPQ